MRRPDHLGPVQIVGYLARYHGIRVSEATASRPLRRHGLQRRPHRVGRRAVHPHRSEKHVPGHHVHMDVTCLTLRGPGGRRLRRSPYTAIDDATRVRALRVYRRHTQQHAIAFVDYVGGPFPFRMHTIRTARGHAFQALFHWHGADHGIRHVYITPRTPPLNGPGRAFASHRPAGVLSTPERHRRR